MYFYVATEVLSWAAFLSIYKRL